MANSLLPSANEPFDEAEDLSKSWAVISGNGGNDGVLNCRKSLSQIVISKGSALSTKIVSAVGDAMQKIGAFGPTPDKDFATISLAALNKLHSLHKEYGKEVISEKCLQDMKETQELCDEREICISVFGKHNCGKSSLLNALLGDEFLPVYEMDETSLSIKIQHDSKIHEGVCTADCPLRSFKSCPRLEVIPKDFSGKIEIFYGTDNIYKQLSKMNAETRTHSRNTTGYSDFPTVVLKANIPLLAGRIPSGWTVSLVDNPGFGETKEHITQLANISMKISSAYIYLLETENIGGQEAVKFFRKLVKREKFSSAMTDGRLVIGISKFDRNYDSRRGRSKPITIQLVKENVVQSIKEATKIEVSESTIIPLCSTWALTSSKLACALSCDSDELDKRLREALTDLEKYPHGDSLPRGQGEGLTDVIEIHDPVKVIECLDHASGIDSLRKWMNKMVESSCIKVWATNLCNQLKFYIEKAGSSIEFRSKQIGNEIGDKQDELDKRMMVYDKITDEKHKIKLEACKMKMESTSVWMELDKCYMHDLETSKPQEVGKAKVRELMGQFRGNCEKKLSTGELSPTELKTDIHKLLIETSTELQKVFNSCCGFWSTHTALIDIVGEIIARIGYLQTEATLLCRLAVDPDEHRGALGQNLSSPFNPESELGLQGREDNGRRPITAPNLGDIKMKIKIPDISLQWWEKVILYLRKLFSSSKATGSGSEGVTESASLSQSIHSDNLPVTDENDDESHNNNIVSTNDRESNKVTTEHNELRQEDESSEMSDSDAEVLDEDSSFDIKQDSTVTDNDIESCSGLFSDESYQSSQTYKKWTSEFDEVLDELQFHMEHECDVYFEKIKYCIIKYFFMQYRRKTQKQLNAFKTKFAAHLKIEQKRLSELQDSIDLLINTYLDLNTEQSHLEAILEQLISALTSEFYT